MSVVELVTQARLQTKKRKSGIPTCNAGAYFEMGELFRRGYDAQLDVRYTIARRSVVRTLVGVPLATAFGVFRANASCRAFNGVGFKTVRWLRSDMYLPRRHRTPSHAEIRARLREIEVITGKLQCRGGRA
jgi:hypothetical protein